MYQLTCSIVLYKNEPELLTRVITSILKNNLQLKIFILDNSPTDDLRKVSSILMNTERIEYIFNKKNLGYGKAHNIALEKALNQSTYHLVLNPDVEFESGVLDDIFNFMENHKTVGQLLPQVLNSDGSIQKLCKLLPTPFNLIGRRFFPNTKWSVKLDVTYHLKGFNYDHCINLPNLSGCFMFLRTEILKKTGYFDTRYFMYLEDVDLTRRIHSISETLFYPYVSIYHGYEKASYFNPAVLKYHLLSAIKYFNKWGWMIDKQRTTFNKAVLKKVRY